MIACTGDSALFKHGEGKNRNLNCSIFRIFILHSEAFFLYFCMIFFFDFSFSFSAYYGQYSWLYSFPTPQDRGKVFDEAAPWFNLLTPWSITHVALL